MNKSQKRKLRKAGRIAIVAGVCVALAGLLIAGIFFAFKSFAPAKKSGENSEASSQLSLQSTQIDLASLPRNGIDPAKAEELNAKLNSELENYYQTKGIDKEDIAVVIETADGQIHYALNEDTPFIAASLFKLPLAMMYCDMIAEGQFGLQDEVYFEEYDIHEEGDNTITQDYAPGDSIPVEVAVRSMLQFSDNTAAAILYNNIGGWNQYLEDQKVYWGDAAETFENPGMENLVTGRQMMNTLRVWESDPEKYTFVTETLKNTTQEEFLNEKLPNAMVQKYGDLGEQINAAGISAYGVPYRAVVLSKTGSSYHDAGAINEIVWNILNDQNSNEE